MSVTSNFEGIVAEELMSLLHEGNQTIQKGSIFIKEGVTTKLHMPRLDVANDPLGAYLADPKTADVNGAIAYSERTLTVSKSQFYDEINLMDYQDVWREFQPSGSLNDLVTNPQIASAIIREVGMSIGSQISKNIWIGDTSGGTLATNRFNGLIKAIDAGSAITVTPQGAITVSNIISVLGACTDAIPDSLFDNPNMIIHMSSTDYRLFQKASQALDFKGADLGEKGEAKYAGYEIRNYAGLPAGRVFVAYATAGRDSNFYGGVYINDDAENVKIAKTGSMSDLHGVKVNIKFGCQVAKVEEVVSYATV
jgi:hypothetical protein